ncbi:MAG: hypothetical protein JRN17_01585 [Nitrososphaerota archaeon]|nr:hypothetical protein [Nitrososphaerota archaeon]
MSLGRYGYDDPGDKKVRIHIMVDKKISNALDKIRAKRSLSELVNGVLAAIVKAYDPGPAAPLVHELEKVLRVHEGRAEASGDSETLVAVRVLKSRLESYSDLASSEASSPRGFKVEGILPQDRTEAEKGRPFAEENLYYTERGYDWYAVPVMCHDTPMTYLRSLRAWKCTVCGYLFGEGKMSDSPMNGNDVLLQSMRRHNEP